MPLAKGLFQMNSCLKQAKGVSLAGLSFFFFFNFLFYQGGKKRGGLCVCGYVNARLGAQPAH